MVYRRSIPPLKALATLECVVRHGSVSAAAEELCVTHGAVSKQLASLSNWIGQPLFADNRRRMVPTPAALRLAHGVEIGMRSIYDALDEICGSAVDEPSLHVVAPATLAMYWLVPRLPTLRRSGFRMKAHVRHTHSHEAWETLPFDLAILADRSSPAAYKRVPIFRDELGLVAAPEFASTTFDRSQIGRLALFESETRPGELDDWLYSVDLDRTKVGPIEVFEHNYIAIEAALMGQGAVVAPLAVVSNHLARGSLIQVLPEVTIPGPEFAAVYDPRSLGERYARAFVDWLQGIALQTIENSLAERRKSLKVVYQQDESGRRSTNRPFAPAAADRQAVSV